MRPATRVGRWLLFEGGHCVRVSLRHYLLFVFGLKTTYPTPNQQEVQ